jgi:hypothetical protein
MDFNLMRMGLSIFLSLNLAFDKIAPLVIITDVVAAVYN